MSSVAAAPQIEESQNMEEAFEGPEDLREEEVVMECGDEGDGEDGDGAVQTPPPKKRPAAATSAKKKSKSIAEVKNEMEKPQAKSKILEQLAELKKQKEVLKKEKAEQAKNLKAQKRMLGNLKAKAARFTNNDLLEVFLLRKKEEEEAMEAGKQAEKPGSSASSS